MALYKIDMKINCTECKKSFDRNDFELHVYKKHFSSTMEALICILWDLGEIYLGLVRESKERPSYVNWKRHDAQVAIIKTVLGKAGMNEEIFLDED